MSNLSVDLLGVCPGHFRTKVFERAVRGHISRRFMLLICVFEDEPASLRAEDTAEYFIIVFKSLVSIN